jgi:hypothetical protein
MARIRRLLGSLEDIEPESSMIASRFVLGVQAAALEAGAALDDATPIPTHASRAAVAAHVVFPAVLIDPSRVRFGPRSASAAAPAPASDRDRTRRMYGTG